MSAENLLPCPFCGGGAVILRRTLGDGWGDLYLATCQKCSAEGLGSSNEAEAIAAWNRRTPQPDALPGDMRERVAQIIEAAIERHNPGNSLRHTLDEADAILSLIQSERGEP